MTESAAITEQTSGMMIPDGPVLNSTEREMIHAIMGKGGTLDMVIPDGAKSGEISDLLALCCKVYTGLRHSTDKLKPIIGKLLFEMKNRPEMYRKLGYTSLADFMSHGMPEKFGICRSDAFDMLRVATNLPFVTMEDWREVGFQKLRPLAHHSVGDRAEALLKVVRANKDLTTQGVKELIYDQGLVDDGELEFVNVTVSMTKPQRDEFFEFCADPLIQAFTGTPSRGKIISMMVKECRSEWMARGLSSES